MYPQFQPEQLSQNIIKRQFDDILRQLPFDDILRQLFGLELRIHISRPLDHLTVRLYTQQKSNKLALITHIIIY